MRWPSYGLNRRRWSGVALVVVVALLGCVTTGFATRNARSAEQRYAAQLMDRYTSDLSRAITTQIQRYGETLVDVSLALGAQSDLAAGDFTWITNKISNRHLPGATSLRYVVSTPESGIAALQSYWRTRGSPGLKLQPAAVTGEEHAFAVFTRSFNGEPVVAGTDLSADPEAAETLREAYAAGGLAVSRAYVLPKDKELPAAAQQLSFVFAVPVYRIGGTFRGWLIMGVHGQELLTATLRTQAHGAVTVELDDPTDPGARTIATSGRPAADYSPALDRVATAVAGRRTWELKVHPTERLLRETDRGIVTTTFVVAMTIALLLTTLVALLTGARNRAMGKVDTATAALRGDIERRQKVETRLRERELELKRMALHDPLTGLANRAGLDARLTETVGAHADVAVLLIDLDGFKLVNDVHGHAAGDAVLTEFAQILLAGVRTGDLAARIGGDEFVVLVTGVPDADQAVAAAQRILAVAASTPVRVGEEVLPVRASIGVATSRPGDTPKELLRRADIAMYQAKHLGTHGVQLHDPSMTDRRAADAQLGEDLAGALERGELHVLYQPLVDLTDSRMVGAEALVRWHHPRLGVVPPAQFIPIAERSGTITEIGLFVLETACLQGAEWNNCYVSVNLSPRQLQEQTLVADVLDVLARTGLAPERLVLEVTESALVDESAGIAKLRAFRDHGIHVAIDDFGTGYSSLHYLTRLPVDILKIDRSFVAELNGTPEGSGITEAILRLSQVLHLTTVAEGIETAEQAAELQLLGCGIGQGYLFARPLSPAELNELLVSPSRQPSSPS
ncbi:bifunctional diguanylate cyclase/phosphodiesterase [Actinoplanes sp. ATCC 53533]|uniref:putative bifunctional diguanylate cyclase/phosphodiesterase n=1 Tax=Actinoplanes sp. ATCC 53533 TaxID=1288362 RepID=UPI000F796D76|nr:bifunctional diguanylate cyclase/phosphodiesterase [Actinoplanes sp. ATCC 53533]RSM70594.1 bifunctional diguanylate cyclase/phosphodiesterase [Actinoplanes sp. ATCC 53533]